MTRVRLVQSPAALVLEPMIMSANGTEIAVGGGTAYNPTPTVSGSRGSGRRRRPYRATRQVVTLPRRGTSRMAHAAMSAITAIAAPPRNTWWMPLVIAAW